MDYKNYNTLVEKQMTRKIFCVRNTIKGLKQFIDSNGGIENCQKNTKEMLLKLESRLKELTQGKEQKNFNF